MTVAERAAYYMKNREAIDEIRAKPQPPSADGYVPWFCNPFSFRKVLNYIGEQHAAPTEPFDPIAESFSNLPVGLDPFQRPDAVDDPRYTVELPQGAGGGVSVTRVPGNAPDAAPYGAPIPAAEQIDASRVIVERDDDR